MHSLPSNVGFEARGFIFGPPLALRLGVPFVPLRKPGKLPGECTPIVVFVTVLFCAPAAAQARRAAL